MGAPLGRAQSGVDLHARFGSLVRAKCGLPGDRPHCWRLNYSAVFLKLRLADFLGAFCGTKLN